MINISEYFRQKLGDLWTQYILNLYITNESFALSLPESEIIDKIKKIDKKEFSLESEYVQYYLEKLADSCIQRCLVSTAKNMANRRKKNKDVEVKVNGHYIINLPQIAFNITKKMGQWPWTNMEELANKFIEYCQSKLKDINIENLEYNNTGCILITFKREFIMNQLIQLAEKSYDMHVEKPETIVVDFSSPNMAKKMHLGHLRSTIIGDVICRFYEFLGHKVHRINHIGDWGRPFAIVITYIMINEIKLDDTVTAEMLQKYYTEGTKEFLKKTEDNTFEQLVYKNVKKLQEKDPIIYSYWQKICKISRDAYQKIYDILKIEITDMGESTYQDGMIEMVNQLEKDKKLKEATGMKIIQVPKISNPFIIQKSTGTGGNFTYDTSDLAALKYRVKTMNADRIYYVVGNEQSNHFELLFKSAEIVDYYDPSKVTLQHIKFGLVQSPSGGKLSARKGEEGQLKFGLQDILDLGKEYAIEQTKKNNELRKEKQEQNVQELDEDKIEEVSTKLSVNCIKYFELTHTRTSDYKIDYQKIFNNKGNSGLYINYVYARMHQIWDKFKKLYNWELYQVIEEAKKEDNYLPEPIETKLMLQLLKFPEVVHLMEHGTNNNTQLMPHNLTDYLYELAQMVSKFYSDPNCYCLNAKDPTNIKVVYYNRILLVTMILKVMNTLFNLLGIEKLDKI